jgi:uncharacterized membrane protein
MALIAIFPEGNAMVRAARTTSQILMHMGVAFTVMYVATGSTAFGGVAALVEPLCNVALMPLHDRAWEKIRQWHEGTAAARMTPALAPVRAGS